MSLIKKAQRKNIPLKIGVTGPSGCITGDTIISLNRAKKGYKQSIKRLYECFNDKKVCGRKPSNKIKTQVRSYSSELKRIVLNDIEAVLYSGKKMVYRLVLENDLYIDATSCHRILTQRGYVPLGKLTTDDCVMCDNIKPLSKGNFFKPRKLGYDLKRRVKYHKYARSVNSTREGSYKEIEIHRLIYEANQNNLKLDDYLYILNNDEKESNKLKQINPKLWDIHHKDFNHHNNNIDNLQKLSPNKHKILHANHSGKDNLNTHYYMKVVSVSEKGIEDTYDISCKAPNHNFVANGLVIHNSGKTYTSLLIAKGMLGSLDDVVVLDTENQSANLYSDLGDYSVLNLEPPFEPKRYVKAIKYILEEAPSTKLIIIDSTSHEWDGEGGCLDIHSKLGGRFQDWGKVGELHKEFISGILQAPVHIICTMRKKQEYTMNQVNGRTKIEKVGMKEVQREGFEYELTLNFDMNMNHLAIASKDRTGMFSTDIPFEIGEKTGIKISEWNSNANNNQ